MKITPLIIALALLVSAPAFADGGRDCPMHGKGKFGGDKAAQWNPTGRPAARSGRAGVPWRRFNGIMETWGRP